jgi:hypothetical protein
VLREKRITSAESTIVILEDSRLCAIKRERVLYLLCVISAIVQINFLVKSRESTFIVATCNKHTTLVSEVGLTPKTCTVAAAGAQHTTTGVRSGINFNTQSIIGLRPHRIPYSHMMESQMMMEFLLADKDDDLSWKDGGRNHL